MIAPHNYRAAALEAASSELSQGSILRVKVVGESMAPFLYPGDTLIVKALNDRPLGPGELVLVRSGRDFITHRVLTNGQIKGDNMRTPDRGISTDEIVGRVVSIIRQEKSLDMRTGCWQTANRMITGLSRAECALARVGSQALQTSGEPVPARPLSGSGRRWLGLQVAAALYHIRRLIVWAALVIDDPEETKRT